MNSYARIRIPGLAGIQMKYANRNPIGLDMRISGFRAFSKDLIMISKIYCCELTLTHSVPQEGMPILAGKHSSRVHICATEYR